MLSDRCAASAVHGVDFYEWPLVPASPLYNVFPASVPRPILVEENKSPGPSRVAMERFIISLTCQLANCHIVLSLLLL